MPTSTQNIVFSAKIEGTSQVINGVNQINLAMTGLASNITRMGGSASAASNILQTAFGYAGGRAIVGGLESIARSLGSVASSARESISDFQRLGGVINVAAARELQENTAIKERIKTGTALGVLNKQQLTQWKNLTESWRPSSLAMMQVDLQQAQAKLNDTYLRQARAKGPSKDGYDVAISESQQRIQTLQGKIAEAQVTYNQLLTAQGPRAVTEEVTKQTMGLDQALQASSGIVDQYLQRIQAQVLHAPVAQQTMAKMFQTLAGYGAGRGAPLGVVETSYQLAQGMSNFGIASGRTNEQLFDMAMAMGQVQSKGKLMAEEMNRQFANAGLTMSDVLKAFDMAYPKFGLTAGNFQAWMKEGKITASLFIEAMRQYFAQWDAGAQRMKSTWAYIPQMLQNIRDTIVRIGFTPLFEQLKKPLAAFIELFDPEKNPGALEGIKAIGQSVGEFIAPAMDWLSHTAVGQLNEFLTGWRYAGSLTGGIANMLGLSIKNWDLKAIFDTSIFQAKAREAGQSIGTNIGGGILSAMLLLPKFGIGLIGGQKQELGWAGTAVNTLWQGIKGAGEGLAQSAAGQLGLPSPQTWEEGINQWSTNWDLLRQIVTGTIAKIATDWSNNWDLLKQIATLGLQEISNAWTTMPVAITSAFDAGLKIITTKAAEMGQAFYDNFSSKVPEPIASWLGIKPTNNNYSNFDWNKNKAYAPTPPVAILPNTAPPFPGAVWDQYSKVWIGIPPTKQMLPNMPAAGPSYSQRYTGPKPTAYKTGNWGGIGAAHIAPPYMGTTPTSVAAATSEEVIGSVAPIAQMSTQLENIVAILGLQGPQAAELFKSSAIDAATSTTTQMTAAQSILQQMTTTGYPQLAQVAAAWQQAQMEGLTNLAGVLQFLFQLMMSMGLGTGAALGGLGIGANPYGDLSGAGGGGTVDAHARHGHFRTSTGRYENPFTSGFDLSYLTAEQIATAAANYNTQQQAEGKPLVSAANPTGEQTEYVRGTANSTDLLTRQIPILIQATWSLPEAIAAALADSDSGGKGGSKKDQGYQGIYGSNISRDYFTSNIKGYARGADFLTPGGSSNDRYPFMALLSGNERVKIMPNGRDSTGVVMVNKSVNIGDVNINSGMDLAMFRTMLARALAT
jgi:tape measure domain-containing protein